jgi:hypothetical protein
LISTNQGGSHGANVSNFVFDGDIVDRGGGRTNEGHLDGLGQRCQMWRQGGRLRQEMRRQGEARVFVNDSDKTVLAVSNQDALKGHEGHHVRVKGSVDNNTLTVSGVRMMKD